MGDALILLTLLAAWAEDINVVLVDPTTDGTSRAQVVLDGPMADQASGASSFRGAIGNGSVDVQSAKKHTGKAHTLLVFDQSGSFRKHWDRAFAEAAAFAEALPAGHTVEVATFGTGYEVHGSASDPTALVALLDQAKQNGPRDKTTRMHSLVKEGINQVAQALPPSGEGLRQVVVFSDLDEEGTFTADQAIDSARSQGVRVNLVFFASESARHTDNAQRLAESTGGHLMDATNGRSPAAELRALATAPKRTWWLQLGFCDAPSSKGASFQDDLEVEVWDAGSRLGASQGFPFRHGADAVSSKPCTKPAPAEPAPQPAEPFPWWWLVLAALLALGFLGLLTLPFLIAVMARGRKAEPEPEQPSDDEPDHLEGDVAPEVFKPVAAGILDRLPPTRMVRMRGPGHLPARIEIARRELTLGASAHNDIVLDADAVSGEHASLELFPSGELWVRDRDSTNGTWVDGQRLASGERRLLRPGTELGFGQHLMFRIEQDTPGGRKAPDPPAPEPPPPQAPKPKGRKTTFRPVKGK